jgi:NAD+ diphosphatase
MAHRLGPLALSRTAVDRAGHLRTDEAWLREAWQLPSTRVLPVLDGTAPARWGDGGAELVLRAPAEAPAGERSFLGLDDAGTAYFAVSASQEDAPDLQVGADVRLAGLRELGTTLGDRDVGLLVNAVALDNWHRTHRHCPRCGTPTETTAAGHVRRCPADGSEHYPRTDPAVIMAIVDADDRILLGHQLRWPEKRFSTLAGFVEPGESLEAAVRREVLEEVGVGVGEVTYLGSQAWPFPSSLMLGFVGVAETTALRPDGEEIAEARWFSRDEVRTMVADGEVLLPSAVSIARRLIEHWYGGPLDDPPPG